MLPGNPKEVSHNLTRRTFAARLRSESGRMEGRAILSFVESARAPKGPELEARSRTCESIRA